MQNYASFRSRVAKSQALVFVSAVIVLLVFLLTSTANAATFAYITESADNAVYLCTLAVGSDGFEITSEKKIATLEEQGEGQGGQNLDGYGLLAFKHKGESRLVVTQNDEFYVYNPSDLNTPLVSRDLKDESIETISKVSENEYKDHPIFVYGGSETGWGVFEFNPETCSVVYGTVGAGDIVANDVDKIVVSGDNIFITITDYNNGQETDSIALIDTSGSVLKQSDGITKVETMKHIDGKVYFSGEYNDEWGLFTIDADMNVSEVFTDQDGEIDGFASDGEGGFYYAKLDVDDDDFFVPCHWDSSTSKHTELGENAYSGNLWFFENNRLFIGDSEYIALLTEDGEVSQSFDGNAEMMVKLVETSTADATLSANSAKITGIAHSSAPDIADGLTLAEVSDITEYMEDADTLEKVSTARASEATSFQSLITLSVDQAGDIVLPYTIALPETFSNADEVKVYFADPSAVAAASVSGVNVAEDDGIIEATLYGTDYEELTDVEDGVRVGATLEKGKIYSVYVAKAVTATESKADVHIVDVNTLPDRVKLNVNFEEINQLTEDDILDGIKGATTKVDSALDDGFKVSTPVKTLSVDVGWSVVSVDIPLTVSYDKFNIYLIKQDSDLFTASASGVSAAADGDIVKATVLGADGNKLKSGNVPSQVYAAAKFATAGNYGMYLATKQDTPASSNNSSSGCNAGFASLFALVSLIFIKSRKH